MLRLNRPLRRTSDADPDDVLGVKFAFHDLGYYDPPTGEFHPWPDAPLFEAIESFQVDNDLDRDGEMLPGGPTELVLNSLPAPGSAPAPSAYGRAVAEGRVRPEDAIPDSESWLDARRRQLGADVDPAAFRQSKDHRGDSGDIMVPRNPFVGGGGGYAALGAALAGAALQSGQPGEIIAAAKRGAFRPSLPALAPSLLEEGRTTSPADGLPGVPSLMEAEGWHRAALPPEKPIPPRDFDPEEQRRLDEELRRPQPGASPRRPPIEQLIPPTMDPRDWIEIFPADPGRDWPIFVENRGKEDTRQLNTKVNRCIDEASARTGVEVKHEGGGRDGKGREIKESHYKNAETGGLKGGSFLDGTYRLLSNGVRILFNTYTAKADGSPDARELGQAVRVMRNKDGNEILVMIPKGDLDYEGCVDFMSDLLEELEKGLPEDAEEDWRRYPER